jgi:hypothetical protein
MYDYEDFLLKLKAGSPEEKLQILRPEAYRLLSQAQAHSLLVLLRLKEDEESLAIEEMSGHMETVVSAIDDIRQLIDAITT